MITLTRITDIKYVNTVMTHPDVLAGISDDDTPLDTYDAIVAMVHNPENVFLRVDDGAACGLFLFAVKPNGQHEMHTCLLPNCRGSKAVEAGMDALRWMFENTKVENINGYAFSTAKHACAFARRIGLRQTVVEPHPSTVKGQKVDRVWFETTRFERSKPDKPQLRRITP
jgi:hypothetical protein